MVNNLISLDLGWLWKATQVCLYCTSSFSKCFSFYFILFIFGCAGSSLLLGLFSTCGEWGLLSRCSEWDLLSSRHAGASHCSGLSCCRAQASGLPDSRAQAQQLWHVRGLAATWHLWSSWIKDGTHVSCTGRGILHHWATREAPMFLFQQDLITGSTLLVMSSEAKMGTSEILQTSVFIQTNIWKTSWLFSWQERSGLGVRTTSFLSRFYSAIFSFCFFQVWKVWKWNC